MKILSKKQRKKFAKTHTFIQAEIICSLCNLPFQITFHPHNLQTDEVCNVGLGGAHVECVNKQQNQRIITPDNPGRNTPVTNIQGHR